MLLWLTAVGDEAVGTIGRNLHVSLCGAHWAVANATIYVPLTLPFARADGVQDSDDVTSKEEQVRPITGTQKQTR